MVVVCVAPVAAAFEDPDTEVARKHFEKGRLAYDAGDYQLALGEFKAAKRAKQAAALDFNIARCYDRLEQYPAAIDAYASYISAQPGAPDVAEVRERIAMLKKRLDSPSTAITPKHDEPPKTDEHNHSLLPPTFDDGTPPPIVIVQPPIDDARARRRRNGAIIGGVVGGVVVIAGVVTLAVLLSRSGPPPLTPSDFGGPWTVTK
jgi:tetratricopeptide (TPR) repeat protein